MRSRFVFCVLAVAALLGATACTAPASPDVEPAAELQLAAGFGHTCALLPDRTVKCWGLNLNGELGNGTNVNSPTPTAVTGLSGVTAIASDYYSTCALLLDTTVECWGAQVLLDDTGATGQSLAPVPVPGLSGVTAFDFGQAGGCAVLADQRVECWLNREVGQVPTIVPNLTGVTDVSVGDRHACALKASGTAVCWGDNNYGELGHGTSTQNGSSIFPPLDVVGLTGIKSIEAFDRNGCAVLADDSAACWGTISRGQTASGTWNNTGKQPTPAPAVELTGITQLAGGYQLACAALSDETAKCWGENDYGGLGDPSLTNSPFIGYPTPRPVVGLSGVMSVTTGTSHACAALTDNSVRCWGRNFEGQLGNGVTGSGGPSPVSVTGL